LSEGIIHRPGGAMRVRQATAVLQARGLRYATAQRFCQPVPIAPWDGVLDASVEFA
jgi:hypothetical protein